MKHKILYTLLAGTLLLFTDSAHSQQLSDPAANIPDGSSVGTGTVSYPYLQNLSVSGGDNHIRTRTPDVPATSMGTSYVRQATDYFDGLGRPLQSVARKGHASGYDIVQSHVYDSAGRESYPYLPYAKPASISDGSLNTTPYTTLTGFYNAAGQDQQPYSRMDYENSPLQRPLKQLSPGKSWVGSERGVTLGYGTNAPVSASHVVSNIPYVVALYQVSARYPLFTVSNGTLVLTGYYDDNSLFITRTTDEDGKVAEEVKDKAGRLIAKKVQYQTAGAVPEINPYVLSNFAWTFYVYDDLDRLVYVLPPAAVTPMESTALVNNIHTYTYTWSVPSQQQLDGLCYQYRYDSLSRMVEKKLPGKGWEYFVYDSRDRLVYSQDGNLRNQGQWAFSVYDALDRPLFNGLTNTSASRTSLQNQMTQPYSAFSTSQLPYYTNNTANGALYPAALAGTTIQAYNYYDNYSPLGGALAYDASPFTSLPLPSTGTVPVPVPATGTKGKSTGSKVSVKDPDNPGSLQWLLAATYYDDYGRAMQARGQNLKGGTDVLSTVYYFQGMPYLNILQHQNPGAKPIPGATDGAHTAYTLTTTYTRNLSADGGNALVASVTRQIDDGTVYPFASYSYDHLGRVVVKQFPVGNELHEYNIRGLVHHIQLANGDPADSNIFDEQLYYDFGFGSKLYNGNIAGITWQMKSSTAPVQAYGYSYDPMNRLTHAEYRRQDNAGAPWVNNTYDYTASSITYDRNGNLLTMNQRVPLLQPGAAPIDLDRLTYTYAAGSNQLQAVSDNVAATATAGYPDFKDGASLSTEYTYDANGNMTADANKKITAITYNYLNLPEKITVADSGSIVYVYDATGNRLQKKIEPVGGTAIVYNYIGDFVYRNDTLQYLNTEEGRARPVANSSGITKFVYDYYAKDHLGNVHSTVTAEPMNELFLASHEISLANTEQLVFDNIGTVRDLKPGSTDPSDTKAARLNAAEADRIVGTSLMLRVMPGDRFAVSADAFYQDPAPSQGTVPADVIVSSLTDALLGGQTYEGVPLSELPDNAKIVETALGAGGLATQISDLANLSDDPSLPKAHLNVLFFDDKFQLRPEYSHIIQLPAGSAGSWTPLALPGLPTQIYPIPGYTLVYVDNQEIGKDVWFDNILIQHYNSEVISEQHYYPFGLTLDIDQEATVTPNPYKYNGKELERHFGLESYEYGARMMDPQLGMWHTVDPLAEQSRRWSPYVYALDNPIRFIDPDGNSAGDYYNKDGKKIGSDENDDHKKYVVTDKSEQKTVKDNTKNGKATKAEEVKSAILLPSNIALSTAKSVLDDTKNTTANDPTGGLHGESAIIYKDGTASRGASGNKGTTDDHNNFTTAENLPELADGKTAADIEVTVHSHATGAFTQGNKVYGGDATLPSPTDRNNSYFTGTTSIIVGPLGQPTARMETDGNSGLSTPVIRQNDNGMVIYRSGHEVLEITEKALKNILKQ